MLGFFVFFFTCGTVEAASKAGSIQVVSSVG